MGFYYFKYIYLTRNESQKGREWMGSCANPILQRMRWNALDDPCRSKQKGRNDAAEEELERERGKCAALETALRNQQAESQILRSALLGVALHLYLAAGKYMILRFKVGICKREALYIWHLIEELLVTCDLLHVIWCSLVYFDKFDSM